MVVPMKYGADAGFPQQCMHRLFPARTKLSEAPFANLIVTSPFIQHQETSHELPGSNAHVLPAILCISVRARRITPGHAAAFDDVLLEQVFEPPCDLIALHLERILLVRVLGDIEQ